jgi:hypothetical protein
MCAGLKKKIVNSYMQHVKNIEEEMWKAERSNRTLSPSSSSYTKVSWMMKLQAVEKLM